VPLSKSNQADLVTALSGTEASSLSDCLPFLSFPISGFSFQPFSLWLAITLRGSCG
jgi:hypothetical protein